MLRLITITRQRHSTKQCSLFIKVSVLERAWAVGWPEYEEEVNLERHMETDIYDVDICVLSVTEPLVICKENPP